MSEPNPPNEPIAKAPRPTRSPAPVDTPQVRFLRAARADRLCVDRIAVHPIYDHEERQGRIATLKAAAASLGQPPPDVSDEPARTMVYLARTPGGVYTHGFIDERRYHRRAFSEYALGESTLSMDHAIAQMLAR